MYSLQLFLLLLETMGVMTKEKTNGIQDIVRSMNLWETSCANKKDGAQFILTNKEFMMLDRISNAPFRVKYKLPIIDSVVVEAGDKKLLLEPSIQNNKEVEMDSIIQAQMKRASSIIQLESAHDRGIYGDGIGVAILDTGIYPHPDFVAGRNRIVAFYDVINGRRSPYDDNGHGTHVCGVIKWKKHNIMDCVIFSERSNCVIWRL